MEITNFGHFTAIPQGGIVFYQNEDRQDWYDLRRSLTNWGPGGEYIDAIYGAWAMVDPATMRVTNVEYDPSRMVPDDKIILGIDADHTDIEVGSTYYVESGNSGHFLSPVKVVDPSAVDAERDLRIIAGFEFNGVLFQSRPEDRENIAGAKSMATDAVALGAQPGDLAWRKLLSPDGPEVFAWIAADNSLVPMDAPTVISFAYAAVAHKERMIFAARAVKSMDPIPEDYAENPAYWPA